MEAELRRRTFTEAPTFAKFVYAEMDRRVTESKIIVDDDLNTDDFEFAFSAMESKPVVLTEKSSEEIFWNGRILPAYPVFNQNLIAGGLETSVEGELTDGMGRLALSLEKGDLRSGSVSSSSTEASDLEGLRGSEAPYSILKQKSAPQSPTQSPPQSTDRCQKSNSTGSSAEFRRFRIRDLVLGRSRNDEKVKTFLLPDAEKEATRSFCCPVNPGNKAARESEKKGKNGNGTGWVKGGAVKELDVVQAHRIYYGKGAAGRRRRFLPFRRDLLVGFFG